MKFLFALLRKPHRFVIAGVKTVLICRCYINEKDFGTYIKLDGAKNFERVNPREINNLGQWYRQTQSWVRRDHAHKREYIVYEQV